MQWISNLILRKAGWVLFLGTTLAVISLYYSVLLYKNLRTEIQELLPTSARSVIDLNEVSSRLNSIETLSILVFSRDIQAGRKFVVDLAAELDVLPRSMVSSVEYKISEELQFFRKRQALYMDLPDLIKIHDYIKDRLKYEREIRNPFNIFLGRELPEPKLDLTALRKKYLGKAGAYENLPGGFYATPDETKRVIILNVPGSNSGIEASKKLKAAVESTVERLNPQSYSSDLSVRYTGGIQDKIEEQSALVEDLELSTIIVTILVTAAMLFFYQNVTGTVALVTSLFMGTFWTFGLSYFLVGYLNANSAFLGSIVIGNGINFGIIFLARYQEEIRNGHRHLRAARIAMVHTATSTWTAALAAGLSYGSLMLTGFRGFRQFGVIGLVGMILCWISAFTLLPAILTLLNKVRPIQLRPNPVGRFSLPDKIAATVGRFPGIICMLSLAATLFCASTLHRLDSTILETDLTRLRNKESLTRGSAYLSRYLDEIFQRFLEPFVILPHDRQAAREIALRLREKQKREGAKSLIANVQTLDDFLPAQQSEKIQVLRQIRRLLPPKIWARVPAEDQKTIRDFLTPQAFQPIQETDLPPLLLSKFRERNGSLGNLVLVEPPLTNETRIGSKLIDLVESMRQIADQVQQNTPVAGAMTVTADMIQAIYRDGPQATLFAFGAVILLVILLFRNLKTVSLVLFTLALGVFWLVGIILGFDLKINFLNFIALPITFGIGVDYGVNIFQRFRERTHSHQPSDILAIVRNTGGAVGLCSLSTVIGYTSLLIAGNQGFVSFGLLAVAGEVTCVAAAIFSLPAFLLLLRRRGR